jgi:hypothetical protein
MIFHYEPPVAPGCGCCSASTPGAKAQQASQGRSTTSAYEPLHRVQVSLKRRNVCQTGRESLLPLLSTLSKPMDWAEEPARSAFKWFENYSGISDVPVRVPNSAFLKPMTERVICAVCKEGPEGKRGCQGTSLCSSCNLQNACCSCMLGTIQ